MAEDLFQIPALIDTVNTKKDKTLKLNVYTTRELSYEENALILSLTQKMGWMVFSEAAIQPSDVPTDPVPEKGEKSPSKRFKDKLFVHYSKKFPTKKEFQQWYESELERVGNLYLEKIND